MPHVLRCPSEGERRQFGTICVIASKGPDCKVVGQVRVPEFVVGDCFDISGDETQENLVSGREVRQKGRDAGRFTHFLTDRHELGGR